MPYKWFVDLSKWNVLTKAQVKEIVDNGCIGFAIKAGQGENAEDPLVAKHVAVSQELGVPYIIYHWADPIKDPIKQARFAVDLAKKHQARGICPDIEQYWMSWDEWYKVIVMHQPGTVRAYGSDYLLRFYSNYLREINRLNRIETKLPIMPYSAQWFLHGYCRPLSVVIRDTCTGYWNAAYVAWKQMDADPMVTWAEFHKTLDNLVLNQKWMPNGISHWDAWQFAVMPMRGFGSIDCDVITDEAAAVYFGTDPIIIPPDEPPSSNFQMEVIADALNVRDEPNATTGKDIGDLTKGALLNVLEIDGSNAWIEFEPGKFACVQNIKGRYMKRHVE